MVIMARIKKTWYPIIAPKIFDEVEIGETLSVTPKDIIGRTVTIPLSSIQSTPKFYVKVKFKIVDVKNNKAITTFIGHEIIREYITHIVRPNTTRVDNNVIVQVKSGEKIRVKGILIFSRRVNVELASKARKIMDKIIKEFASKSDFDEFVKAMIFDEITKKIKEECKKLYPVSKVEIRKSEVLS
jgi:small subunit ribosomal protein S3Ae